MFSVFGSLTLFVFVIDVAAVQDQRNVSAAGVGSTVGESSPLLRVPSKDKIEENFEQINLNIQQDLVEDEPQQGLKLPIMRTEYQAEDRIEAAPNKEHQFILSFNGRSRVHDNNQTEKPESRNLSALRSVSDEDIYVSLQLGEAKSKKRKYLDSLCSIKDAK